MTLSRLALTAAIALACGAAFAQPAGKPKFGDYGFDTAGMDRTVQPGNDFYAYANGAWAKTTQIPPDKSRWGTFNILDEEATARLRSQFEALAKSSPAKGTPRQQAGDFYQGYLDQAAIDKRGLGPVQGDLKRILLISGKSALASELGRTLRTDVDPFNDGNYDTTNLFGAWIGEDTNQPTRYIPYLFQGGLSMPSPDYYLDQAPRFAEARAAFKAHAAKVFALAGLKDADARAARVLALETAIAKTHFDPVASQDYAKSNKRWSRAELTARAPGLDWTAFLVSAGLQGQQTFGVWQPQAISGIAALAATQPLTSWQDFLILHRLDDRSEVLPKSFADEHFAFYGKVLNGTPQQPERWKLAVQATSGALIDPVGQIYTAAYFPPAAKARAEAMVKNIVAAFAARIDKLDWMSAQTKAKAHEKIRTLQVSVGYPNKWRDYSKLAISRDDAAGNLDRASLFRYRMNLAKLGKPVDRTEWHMAAQAVNAQNDPIPNLILFPAAILEPPFFDPAADPAVNYGSIGAVIGHEISHSFDNSGALFDAHGKMANWWKPEDFAHFDAAGKALAKQYDAYEPLPGLHINGQQTLGENIADLAGIAASLDAYHLSLGGKPAPVIDGMTGDQRFFLGFAQNYRELAREPALRRIVLTNGHSPGRFRSYTVRNVDAWYQAFAAKPGQTLYLAPKDRVRVW
jgi:putative endopeptidase